MERLIMSEAKTLRSLMFSVVGLITAKDPGFLTSHVILFMEARESLMSAGNPGSFTGCLAWS
eukprot:5638625-Karenia_brevis.AAC.1